MEKRYYPRVATDLPASVANKEGISFNVRALDASCEGISIECNTIQRNLVTPGGSFISGGKPIELMISLDVPDDQGDIDKIQAMCHVAFSRRIANNRCKIGMRFIELGENGLSKLSRYIESSLDGAEYHHSC